MNVGSTVSHYTILERLGKGGMGTVYKARDLKLGRFVAIKVLAAGVGSDPEQRDRFMQEARAASAIDHPNIGAVYEIDESPDGELFIAMAYYEGRDLKHTIREGPIPPDEGVRIASQVARGLAEAHSRGIVHRDVKPANIVVTPQGTVKIIDFGLAKLTDGLQLTRAGTSLGTLAYMSPEQLRAEEIGAETDVWALGIILFEMITGKHPFHGEFEAALMYSIANEPPLDLRAFLPDAPDELHELIFRMLSKKRAERPGTMGEVAGTLERIARGEISGTGPAATTTMPGPRDPAVSDQTPGSRTGATFATRVPKPFAGGSRATIAAAAAALVVGAIALYLIFRPASPPTIPAAQASIAVVPFDVSGEDDFLYLGAGMASEIAEILSSARDLLVISRNSASAFSRQSVSDSTIADSLGVRYVLRGSIRATAAQIFYDVLLYDHLAREIVHQRSSTISRKDVIGFPPAVGMEIAGLIGLDLPAGAAEPMTSSAAAYESYLQGSFHRDRLRKEDIELSLAYFRQAIEADTSFVRGRLGYASTLVEGYLQGYLSEEPAVTDADALCRTVMSVDSLNDNALAIHGKILDLKGDRQGGLESLNRALEINPENEYALTVLAQVYALELNDPVRGIVLLKRLRQIDPLNWLTNLNLGVAFAQSRNYEEALSAFRHAAELNPTHPWPVYSLGYLYEILGRLDSAAAAYAGAIRLEPTDPKAYVSLISLDIAMERFRAADSVAVEALRRNQGNHTLIYLRGLSALLGKKAAEARRILGEGYRLVESRLKEEPESVEYTLYLGLFAARLENRTGAVEAAERAARLDSTHEETAITIARIYAATGMKEPAVEWFAKARAMNPEYNEAYLMTATDFERLRRDPDLLLAARR